MCVKYVFCFIFFIAPREIMLNDVHASEHYEVFFASGYIYLCLIIPLTRWCVYECTIKKKKEEI